jgi:hypothetical protein
VTAWQQPLLGCCYDYTIINTALAKSLGRSLWLLQPLPRFLALHSLQNQQRENGGKDKRP